MLDMLLTCCGAPCQLARVAQLLRAHPRPGQAQGVPVLLQPRDVAPQPSETEGPGFRVDLETFTNKSVGPKQLVSIAQSHGNLMYVM